MLAKCGVCVAPNRARTRGFAAVTVARMDGSLVADLTSVGLKLCERTERILRGGPLAGRRRWAPACQALQRRAEWPDARAGAWAAPVFDLARRCPRSALEERTARRARTMRIARTRPVAGSAVAVVDPTRLTQRSERHYACNCSSKTLGIRVLLLESLKSRTALRRPH